MDFRGPIGPANPYPNDTTAAQGPIAALIGYGYGTRGYGQLDTFLPPRNPGNRVSSVEWNAMQTAMSNINIHTGSGLTLQPRVTPSGRIIAEDGVDSTANIEALATTLDINRLQYDPDQMSTDLAITSGRDTKWNGTITHEFTVDFDSEDHARWYFNSGGSIDISGTRYGGTATGSTVVVAPFVSPRVYPVTNAAWSNFLNTYGVWSEATPNNKSDRANQIQVYYRNFTAPYDGRYRIRFQADNRITLYVDGIIIGSNSDFQKNPKEVDLELESGNHVLRIEALNVSLLGGPTKWKYNPAGWAITIEAVLWDTRSYLDAEIISSSPLLESPAVYPVIPFNTWSEFMNRYSVWVNPGTAVLKDQTQTIYRLFNAPVTGSYTFYIAADDRIKISVDGVLRANVYRNYNAANPTEVIVNLTAGSHVLKFEALNDGSGNTWVSNPGGWAVLITSGIIWDTRTRAAEDYVSDTSFKSSAVYPVTSSAGDWNNFMNTYAVWVKPEAESVVNVTQTRHRLLTIPYSDVYTIDYAVDDNMYVYLDEKEIIYAGVTTSRKNNLFGTKKLQIDQNTYVIRVDAYNNPVRGGWAIRIKDSTGKVIWTTRDSLDAEIVPGPKGPNVTIFNDGTTNSRISNLFVNAGTVSIEATNAVIVNSGSGYGNVNASAGYYNLKNEYTPVYSFYTVPGATTVNILKETYAAPSVSYTYIVPIDTTQLTFKLWGAGGAGGAMFAPGVAYFGGAGAFVQATVPVIPGEILTIKVGGGGQPGISVNKKWEDTYGGGGGGWSGVFRGEQPLLIAAGGGGSPANFYDQKLGTVIWNTRSALAAETVVYPPFFSPAVYALNAVPTWSTFMNNNSVWVNAGTDFLKNKPQTIYRNLNITTADSYKFSVAADDRVIVSLDNVEIANVYRNFGSAAKQFTTNVAVGNHVLKFEALNDGNGSNWTTNPAGWAVRIDDSSNTTVWSSRAALAAEQIVPEPINSPQVYSVSNTAWSVFMNEYAVWPVNSSSIPAPTNYTIYRNFTVPTNGNYIFRYAADNKLILKIDGVTIGTVESFTGDPKETTVALSQGLHILEFVVTNNNNPSPAGYAVSIVKPIAGGYAGAGGIVEGEDSKLGNGAVNAQGGTQTTGGQGGFSVSDEEDGENGLFLQGGAGGNRDVKNRNWYSRKTYQTASVYPTGINGGVNGGGQGGAGGSGGGGGGYFGGGGGSATRSPSIFTSGGGAGGSSYVTALATNVITFVSTDGFSAPNRTDPDYRTGVAAGGAGGVTVGDLGKAGGSGLVAIYQANAITPINSENWIVEAKVENISGRYGGNGSRLRIKSSISSNIVVDNSGVVSTAKPAYITVIDESSQSVSNMENSYQLFRSQYPQHRLYLLWPRQNNDPVSVLKIPPSWGTNPNDFGPIQVRRDNNNVNLRDNWFNICNLQDLPGGSQVGIFLDSSGSLDGDVKASYDLFVQTLASKNIIQKTVKNSNENWISPLLTMPASVPAVKPVTIQNIVDGITESVVKRRKAAGVLTIAEPRFETITPLTVGGVQEPPKEPFKVNPTCIAVIDEVSPTPATIQASYDKFRKNCPDSYLFLLQPRKTSQSTIKLPSGWSEIAGDFGPIEVNRDNGNRNLISDWYSFATLDRLPDNSTVQLFIDNSGSMTTNTVQASYDHFKARCQERGIKIILYTNKQENWIAPFKCGAALIVEEPVDDNNPPVPPPPAPTPPTSTPPKTGTPIGGGGGGGSDKTTTYKGNNGEVYATRNEAITYGGGVKSITTESVTSKDNKSIQGGTNFGTVTAVSNTNKSNPSGGGSAGGSGGGGCCFIMLEARYGDGTMDAVVRRYRDEYMTERNRRGYYKIAEVFVPLMRKSKLFKWVVTKTMADPLVAYGKYYYGENTWGWVFKPVKNFWMGVFDTVGGDTKFIRENGEEI
jgi:hypothetical protein